MPIYFLLAVFHTINREENSQNLSLTMQTVKIAKAKPSQKPSQAKQRRSRAPHPSRAKQRQSNSDGKAERAKEGPASEILRKEISRNGASRRGDCLSEASLSPFSGMQTDFSKISAALNFCFFWFKPKEKITFNGFQTF